MAGMFDKYRDTFPVNIDDTPLRVRVTVQDKIAFARAEEIKDTPGKIEALNTACLAMLVREYPSEDPLLLQGYLDKNLNEFMDEVMVGSGQITRKELEGYKKKQREQTEKNSEAHDAGGVPATPSVEGSEGKTG